MALPRGLARLKSQGYSSTLFLPGEITSRWGSRAPGSLSVSEPRDWEFLGQCPRSPFSAPLGFSLGGHLAGHRLAV